jgi:hypothetical protein
MTSAYLFAQLLTRNADTGRNAETLKGGALSVGGVAATLGEERYVCED